MSTTHLVLFFFALSNPIALALDSSSSSQQASITPGTNSFTSAFANGFTMVGATELGDKTFWLAALMAMRYNRIVVYSGAIGALIIMTILSVVIGVAVPALMSRKYTHYAAAFLFAYFGAKLLYEASQMQPGQVSEELQEAEEHLAEKGVISRGDGKVDEEMGTSDKTVAGDEQSSNGADSVSAAQQRHSKVTASVPTESTGSSSSAQLPAASSKVSAPISLSTWANEWPILAQAFTITFVAEWGDRSQIATIAMAAAQNAFGITIGACIGHALCTGLAVVGGRMLSSRISERAVAIAGGSLFLVFSLHSLYVGPGE